MKEELNTNKKEFSSETSKFLFKLSLQDLLRLTMFGTLTALAKGIPRLPLHMPGHTSIWWMGILVIGKGLIKKPEAGTVMGVVSGILSVILGMGGEGVFVFFKYLVPGVLLDILAPLFANKLENPFVGIISR